MTNENLGLAMLLVGGVGLIAYYKSQSHEVGRLVLTWKKNPDGTCTFTYDDGSQEIANCAQAPA